MSKIIGNEKIKTELKRAVQNNDILHSYMFIGQEGIGKKKIAKEFARTILCETKKNNCNCKSCTSFKNGNNPDFYLISEEGNSIKIDQIRDLIEKAYEKPIASEKKVYIIDNSDKMTVEAQNSLLKTLEEPPDYMVLILITSNIDNILNTVKSRCVKLSFESLSNDEIKEVLNERGLNTNLNENMYELFNGSIARALKILEKQEDFTQLEKFVNNISKEDKLEYITSYKSLFTKENINEYLEYALVLFFNKGKKTNSIRYLNCVNIIQETINRLKSNANFDMSVDNMLFKLWEEVN